MVGLRHLGRDLGAERVAIDLARLGDVAHGDGNVIETADHSVLYSCKTGKAIIPSRRAHGTSAFCPSARRPQRARRGGSPRRRRRDRRGACAAASSKVARTASRRVSCIEAPSRSRSGMPMRSSSGSLDEFAFVGDGQRHRNHPGKAQPPAVGDGAGVGLDQQRAVLVDASRRHLVDDAGIAGELHQIAVAALDHLRTRANGARARRVPTDAAPRHAPGSGFSA